MRAAYVSGDAWCIVHGDLLVVLDRGLDAPTASAIHAAMTPAGLRDEPLALAVLEPVVDGWLLWRRRGVPAVADVPLPDRGGEAWGSDLLPLGATVAFGAVGALADAMPIEGGVVRASAVRLELGDAVVDRADVVGTVATQADAVGPTDAAAESMPAPAPEHEQEQVSALAAGPTPTQEPASAPDTDSTSAVEPASDVAPASEPTSEPVIGIIDSVPGFIRPATTVEVPDELPMGDHDGMTVSGDAARALAAAAREQQPPPVLGPATGPVVLSTLCAAGHVNPPGTATCSCGAPIASGSADQRARPEFAELVLPSGDRVPLGRGVVLGRRPRSRRVEDGRVPRLVTVDSPSEDISRSHLEVRCEDWNVLAIDLESTNGTVLLRDGAAPMRLRADAPQLLAFGDRLDLGDGVVVRVERARTAGAS